MSVKTYLVGMLGLGLAATSAWGTVGVDTITQGTWKSPSKYGTNGYVLLDWANNDSLNAGDKSGDLASLPSYISSYAYAGTPYGIYSGTSLVNALQNPTAPSGLRNLGLIYSGSSAGNSFTITLTPAVSQSFNLELYFDEPSSSGRAETISFTGAGSNVPITGTSTDSVSNFGAGGIWHIYPVSLTVGTPAVITITNSVNGNNAVVSALMFDAAAAPEPASLALLGLGGVGLLMRRRRKA